VDRNTKEEKINSKISVIIPNYNDSRIERTIDKIANQSYGNFELIIVEGCINNNNTLNIYKKYKKHISHLIHEPDQGIFDALNKGIKIASGDLIFLIGSDDVLSDNNCFKAVIKKINKHPSSDGVCLGCKFITSKNKIVREWKLNNISSSQIKWGIMPPHFSLFLKRSIYNEVGYFDFDETYIASDSEWLLRFASKKEIEIPVINDHFVCMEHGGASTGSIHYIIKSIFVIAKAAKKHSVKQWPLTPLIKLASKLFQIKFT
jgi:glycosyltransferase involved in cell wall biosynthesis